MYNNFDEYPKTFERSVFDLNNKKDEKIIKYLYGNRDNWTDITGHFPKDYFKKRYFNYQDLLDYRETIQ